MEARSVPAAPAVPLLERLRTSPAARAVSERPQWAGVTVIALFVLILIVAYGIHDVAQTGLNGLSLGSVYALGAIGLTLVYGILKLVNFAHGDFLTFGAFMAFLMNVTWGLPLIVAVLFGMALSALLGVVIERIMWAPMRARKAGMLQLVLMSIGLGFV